MVKLDRLKIRHLRTLIAVAESGSLVRAADAMSVTQPAVSKTVTELESIVGCHLFERMPRGVKLTSAGRLLLLHAGIGLRAIREGLDALEIGEEGERPAVIVGALPNVATTVLPPALLRLAIAQPRAHVTVRTGSNAQLIAALRQGVLDLVVGRLAEPSNMQGLSFEHLYTEPLVLVTRAGHVLARGKTLDPLVLRQHRLLLPDAGTRIREAADRFFVANGVGLPLLTLETIDLSFGRSYVLQSDAVWFVPLGAVEDDLRSGTLQRLSFDTRITEGPVGLTLRVDQVPSEVMLWLTEEIRRRARERTGAPQTGTPTLEDHRHDVSRG